MAKVRSGHLDGDAHLLQPGPHALPDPVSQGLFPGGGSEDGYLRLWVEAGRRQVGVVGGQDSGPAVVVAGVEDMGDGLPDPLGRLAGPELVEHQHLGLEHRPQDLHLSCFCRAVVAVLDLLEEVAVIVEQAQGTAFSHQCTQDADGEVGLADADRAGEQQAVARRFERVAANEAAGHHERFRKRATSPAKPGS